MQPSRLRDAFARRFGLEPAVVARAPGRVNLIGEHTDYNEGFVLPVALEPCTRVAAGPRGDGCICAVACDLEEEAVWPVDAWCRADCPHWTSYIAGVVVLLRARGAPLIGCNLIITSDVPVGSGLSSSAALEVSAAKALAALSGDAIDGTTLADLCGEAERRFAGVPCGIMDQYVSVLARADTAFLLDCRARSWEHVPLDLDEHVLVIVNSGVRHELAAGEYAKRRRECAAAVEYLRQWDPAVRALRDVDSAAVAAHTARLDPIAAKRARHVISENARTIQMADALRKRDWAEIGRLMAASHRSLRDDYEVSCRELDRLVEIVSEVPGVVGARMTGGGFGGCIVAIADRACLPEIASALREGYDGAGHGRSSILLSRAGGGAAIEAT
jgi:galactokinase